MTRMLVFFLLLLFGCNRPAPEVYTERPQPSPSVAPEKVAVISDFDQRIQQLAEGATIGDWRDMSNADRLAVLQYFAAKRHPDDDETVRAERVFSYVLLARNAERLNETYGFRLYSVCEAADQDIAESSRLDE